MGSETHWLQVSPPVMLYVFNTFSEIIPKFEFYILLLLRPY